MYVVDVITYRSIKYNPSVSVFDLAFNKKTFERDNDDHRRTKLNKRNIILYSCNINRQLRNHACNVHNMFTVRCFLLYSPFHA